MIVIVIVHTFYTQGDLDFSSRFLCAFWFTAVGLSTTMKATLLCDKCKKNEVQIYNDCCNCCISCWYDMTDPKVS